MEARLLCLQKKGHASPVNQGPWLVTNGTGVAISQMHLLKTPPCFFTTDAAQKELIERLTAILLTPSFAAEELGWSQWRLHHIGEIERGFLPGGAWGQMATVMIARNALVDGGGHSAQALGSASSTLRGGR